MKKIDLINRAYSQLRISGLTVNPSAEDVEVALYRLEDMLAEWEDSYNICVGYNFEDDPDPTSESGTPRNANQAIQTNLAARLIPDFNKKVPQTLLAQASQSFNLLCGNKFQLRETQYPRRMPRGSGSTRYNQWNRFFRPSERAPLDCETQKIPVGLPFEYSIDWSDFLQNGESITSFTITVSDGLTLLSSVNNTPVITYEVQGNSLSSLEKVKVRITTSIGRVNERVVNYEIVPPEVV